jgi:hypothetical protein
MSGAIPLLLLYAFVAWTGTLLLLLLLLLLFVISFMQGIYTCIPETNHVSRQYSVAAVL